MILAPIIWFIHDVEFGRVEAFIRDSFQYLNSTSNVEKSIVTVSINKDKNNFKRPFVLADLKSVISKILENKPRLLIIALSAPELTDGEVDLRTDFFNFLKDKENVVFFTNQSQEQKYNFFHDPILGKFPRQLNMQMPMDKQIGARDYKRRRSIVSYDNTGNASEFDAIKQIGFSPKDPSHFKYAWGWWGSRQAYLKSFPVGTFGSFDARWLLSQNNDTLSLSDKTVILGSNDEYSYLFSHSVFDLLGKIGTPDYKAFPPADSLANALNLYITGDYMKLLQNFNDLLVTYLILIFLIFLNVNIRVKIVAFASLIPVIIFASALLYALTDFYIDLSRSVTLLFFLQYFAIPFVVINIFKEQEAKKLHEINDTRIDALLTVSEKVAHDIRSPLSVINLVAAKAIFPDSEYKEIFDSAVARIDETATKILTRYRTKTGSESETPEPIDVAEIIQLIFKEKKSLNPRIDFELVVSTESTMALGLKLDLERIVSNIIDNSVFAMKAILQPKIFIAVEDFENYIRISISDNGVGIPEQILKLLGNVRLTTKADTNEGNGIGLLHAKRVIERLNGVFKIQSKENLGTTIEISLPKP